MNRRLMAKLLLASLVVIMLSMDISTFAASEAVEQTSIDTQESDEIEDLLQTYTDVTLDQTIKGTSDESADQITQTPTDKMISEVNLQEVEKESMISGWVEVDNQKMYYDENGDAVVGVYEIDENIYVFDKNGILLIGYFEYEGKKYCSDTEGVLKSGWIKVENTWKYFDLHNEFSEIEVKSTDGYWYVLENGKVSYFANTDTLLKNCWKSFSGKGYRFDQEGFAVTGWFKSGNYMYYADENGVMLKGFRKIDGKTCYFDNSYRCVTGWKSIDGKGYYFGNDGYAITGWFKSGNYMYYADEDGVMLKGIRKVDDKTCYFDNSYRCVTGWKSINGKGYYFGNDGYAMTGWFQNGSYWYYADENGVMLKGPREISGKIYCFDNSYHLCKGWYKYGKLSYFLNVSDVAEECYAVYSGQLKQGWITFDNGQKCYVNNKGSYVRGWQTISQKKYYFNSYGIMQSGWCNSYFFDYSGVYLPMNKPTISTIASNYYGKVVVGWNKVDEIDDYILQYSTSSEFLPSSTESVTINNTTTYQYKLEGLQPEKMYYFRLQYYAEGGDKKNPDIAYSKYSDTKKMLVKGEGEPTETSATISNCQITSGNRDIGITVQFDAILEDQLRSADTKYYVVQTESYGNTIDVTVPCASLKKNFNVSVEFVIAGSDINQALMNKFALAVKKSDGTYQVVSKPKGITNPEAIAQNTSEIFKASSKKGLQGVAYASNGNQPVDARYANSKQTLINLDIADVVNPKSDYTTFTYKGTSYRFSNCSALVANIKSLNAGYKQYVYGNDGTTKVAVTLCLLLSYDSANSYLIDPAARSSGHSYYLLNVREENARETLEALFVYLGELFGQEDCYVTNWILGNEINSSRAWNYGGSLSFDTYMTCYTTAFRLLYNAVKSEKTGNTVCISLDNGWNAAPDTYAGKTTLDSFAKKINAMNSNIEWSIAYHPYSYPLTRGDFWNDSSNTTNSTSTKYISMKNITVLTNYAASLEKTYKKDTGSIRVLLTEQGYSYGAGAETQATAIARGYYIAEFNDRIDAFIIRAIVDDADEAKGKLYFGLMNSQQEKRIAFYVYEYMDTDLSKLKATSASSVVSNVNESKFNSAKNILCNTNWKSIVPGFSASKLANIK